MKFQKAKKKAVPGKNHPNPAAKHAPRQKANRNAAKPPKPTATANQKSHPHHKPEIILQPELAPREKMANPLKTPQQRERYAQLIAELKKKHLQPKPKAYHALGLAKESVWLDVQDIKFPEKFQEIFDEHINGWAGKSFKRQKTEKELSMEWRVRLKAKQEQQRQESVTAQATGELDGEFSADEMPRQAAQSRPNTVKTGPKTGIPAQPRSVPNGTSGAQNQARPKKAPATTTKSGVDLAAQQRAIEMYRLMKQKQRLQDKTQRR